MSEMTFYSDDASVVDGSVDHLGDPSDWASLRAAAGNEVSYTTDNRPFGINSSATANKWRSLYRLIYLFNTAALPDDAIIDGAVLSLFGSSKTDNLGINPSAVVVSSAPASNTVLAAGDFDSLGVVALSNVIAYADWSITGYNDFTLNAAGLALISKTGITKLGIKDYYYDLLGNTPAYSASKTSYVWSWMAEKGTTYRPRLVVTYHVSTLPTVTTQAANSSQGGFTGNGTIVSTGGLDCTRRGFCYYQGTSGDPTTSDSVVYEDGTFGAGAFDLAVSGLLEDENYRVRAYAISSAGTGYGDTVDVVTSASTGLEAAQISASRTPYIHCVLYSNSGGDTYNYSTDSLDRIILLDYTEEPYNEYAYIMLRDYDRIVPEDLTGYYVDIGIGDVVGSSPEYRTYPRMWVKHQQIISSGGRLVTILELEGMWSKLKETTMLLGSAPYYNEIFTTETVLDLIALFLSEADPAMSLAALGSQDDGIIDTYTPNFAVNETELFEDAASCIYRAIKMTKCFLRPKAGLQFEIRYPQDSDSTELSIYSEGEGVQVFYEYIHRTNLIIPNHVYCVANEGEDGLWTNKIIVEASDPASISKYGDSPIIVLAPEIDNETDATNRAESVLARVAMEDSGGSMILPHDCRLELYDKIGITDMRGT